MHVTGRELLVGAGSVLPHVSWGWNTGPQAWQQAHFLRCRPSASELATFKGQNWHPVLWYMLMVATLRSSQQILGQLGLLELLPPKTKA